MYKGLGVSVLGHFVYRGFYFGLFDTCKPLVPDNFFAKFFLAQGVTITASLASYPLDTIRVRLQMDAGRAKHNYKGIKDCTN